MKYIFKTDYSASYPLPACAKATPPCSVAMRAPRLFKKGEVIEGIPQGPSVQCIKAPCGNLENQIPTHVFLQTGPTPAENEKRITEGFMIPIGVLSPGGVYYKKEENKELNKDPWTGGVEWDKVFSFKNLFWLVVLVYLAYLFMKHVLPLAKKSFKTT